MMHTWRNWSRLEETVPARIHSPEGIDDVRGALRDAREKGHTVKMVGSGHSFTGIAVAEGVQLLPERLVGITSIDPDKLTVTALAGTPLSRLNAELERAGLTLHNMGDIDKQTLAGAISTGTHGTGGKRASLADQVVGLEMVTADGAVVRADETQNVALLNTARIGLGALGILTSLTFRVEPMFTLRAHEGPMSWSDTLAGFDDLVAEHDYVEAYWFPHTEQMSVKRNDRIETGAEPLSRWKRWFDDEFLANTAFGWMNAVGNLRPGMVPTMAQLAARSLSERTFSDVPHKVFTSPRRVVFKEMEYALPREAGLSALREARELIERRGWPISFPVEIRVAPGDGIPLSPASGRDTLYLAFHVNQHTDHRAYFGEVETLLRGYEGRPHWGKLHTRTAADLAPVYPLWEEFLDLRERLDPDRAFTNTYLRRVLGD